MKYFFVIVLSFIHLASFSQKRKKNSVYDPEKLELKENRIFAGKDTLVVNTFENGENHSIGKYALDASGKRTYLKVGHWIHYFRNGKIESEGDYEIGSYLNCGPGGLQREYYHYKVGQWKYYDTNGSVEASGNYVSFKSHIKTSCEGGDALTFMRPDDNWNFPMGNNKELNKRINSVLLYDGFNTSLYRLKEDDDVEVELFLKK